MSADSPNRIARLREIQGLSREDVARRLGKESERTVRRWENGETTISDDDKLALAELFGVTVPWMMRWTDGENGNGGQQEHAA